MKGILDLNEEIFRDNVCPFLDRKSILELMEENKTLSKHFRLDHYFCRDHGTCLSIVSDEERRGFQRRKNQKNIEYDRLITDHPGCTMGLDGRLRCEECNNFEDLDDFEECGMCNRSACRNCSRNNMTTCDLCNDTHCQECRDIYRCDDCEQCFCYCCREGAHCQQCDLDYCVECSIVDDNLCISCADFVNDIMPSEEEE